MKTIVLKAEDLNAFIEKHGNAVLNVFQEGKIIEKAPDGYFKQYGVTGFEHVAYRVIYRDDLHNKGIDNV